jgi:hypothetical protein
LLLGDDESFFVATEDSLQTALHTFCVTLSKHYLKFLPKKKKQTNKQMSGCRRKFKAVNYNK